MKILTLFIILVYGWILNAGSTDIKYSFNYPETSKIYNEYGPLNGGEAHNIYKSNYCPGVKGTMLRLLGEGDYVSTPLQTVQAFDSSTLSVYFRADVLNKPPSTIFTFYAADEKYIGLQIINGYLNLIDKADSKDARRWQVGPKIKQGVWYHVTFTIDKGNWRLYLDGKLICNEKRATTIKSLNPQTLYLGADYHSAVSAVRRLAGAIDEFELTKEVRPPVKNIDYKKLPAPKPFLRAWNILAENPSEVNAEVDAENAKIIINGKPYSPVLYHGAGFLKYDYFLETLPDIASAGYSLFKCPVGGRDDFSTGSWWIGPDKYDFSKVQRRLESFFLKNPDMWTILVIGASPPPWWEKLHKNDIAVNEKGEKAKYGYYNAAHSFSSKQWLEDAKKALSALVAYIESTPYNSRVIGYQVCAGKYGEWIRWEHNSFLKYLGDYSKAEQQGFRQWIKDHYKDKATLEKAWGQPDINFADVHIPTEAKRRNAGKGYFVDPVAERDIIDYRVYVNDSNQEALIELADHMKKILKQKKLIGAYYYYSLANIGTNLSFGTEAGNLLADKVLRCKSIDFLGNPYHYDLRGMGDCNASMGAPASLRAFGKLWLDEADMRTVLGKGGSYNNAADLDETLAVLWRSFGRSLTQGGGLWWFPITGADCFSSPRIIDAFGRMKQEMDRAPQAYSQENRKLAIAVIGDVYAHCFRRYQGNDTLSGNLITKARRDFAQAGVDADFYMIDDIDAMPDDYKVYVFLNSFYLNDKQREIITKRFKKNNNLLVWTYAAGYFSNKEYFQPINTSVENMEKIVGMKIASSETPSTLLARIVNPEIKSDGLLGIDRKYSPAFWSVDPDAVKVAVYAKASELSGKTAIALKQLAASRSLYIAVPEFSPALIRWFAKLGGAHVYNNDPPSAIFFASSNYLMIHTAKAGTYTIDLPAEYTCISDVVTGKVYGKNCSLLKLDIPRHRTVLLRLER